MSTSLSDFADNLSEFNKKNVKHILKEKKSNQNVNARNVGTKML